MMPVRVLVVDDSAFVRKTIGMILDRSPHLEVVGYAGDGQEALDQVLRLKPDVVTVDLEMPIRNGVHFIVAQMARKPLPIVVISSVDPGGVLAAASMRAGAVEFVLKPTHLADQRLALIEEELLRKVHAVAAIPGERLLGPALVEDSPSDLPAHFIPQAVVIGVSTGGPQLLHQFLPKLPANFPLPLALVIHMPVGFTGPLAERLNSSCAIEVLEASAGLAMKPGRCLIGRAGQHFRLSSAGSDTISARLSLTPTEGNYRPSVDTLFQSASECYGAGLLAFVLTGMGHDGQEGSAWIKANGGRVYTQTQASCTVWGMPRAVAESGLSDGEVTPGEIVPFLLRLTSLNT